jgi:hypothetical protein
VIAPRAARRWRLGVTRGRGRRLGGRNRWGRGLAEELLRTARRGHGRSGSGPVDARSRCSERAPGGPRREGYAGADLRNDARRVVTSARRRRRSGVRGVGWEDRERRWGLQGGRDGSWWELWRGMGADERGPPF